VEVFDMSGNLALPAAAGLHVREHLSVLAAAEKRALIRMARRIPPGINSDHLSILSLASMMAAACALAAVRLTPWAALAAVACLAANWFGDSLDGTLARVRGHERPRYGYYVDHVIDLAATTCLLIGLACSGLMSPTVAMALLAAYLLVCGESYLATHATSIFRMSFLGFGPTELRIVLAIGILKAVLTPRISVGSLEGVLLLDVGGVVALAGLLIAFLVGALRNTRSLYAAEPLPQPGE
jgi:archaetidylinositol phosphate synthase